VRADGGVLDDATDDHNGKVQRQALLAPRIAMRGKIILMKLQLADPLIEAQRQEANRFKRDVQLRQLGEKTEAAREALDKLRSPQPSPLARLFGLQRTAPPDAAPAASHRAEVY
jgi:hypothetical protein